MTDSFTLGLIGFSLIYFVLIASFTWGWIREPGKITNTTRNKNFVSIIIAVRNEEKNLQELLGSLFSQNYPQDLFEVIICDDASEDNTINVAEGFIQLYKNIKITKTPAGGLKGKKEALKRGFKDARGEILITTDADCTFGPNWLRSIVNAFNSNYNPILIIGPVAIDYSNNSFFSRLQALEFMSLAGSTAGASNIGLPIMCNGANLAITREGWLVAENQIKGNQYESGDDIFLLHAIKKLYPGRILYLKNQESIVMTEPSKSIKEFLSQRMRWAGKSAGYSDFFTLTTGTVIAGYNILLSIWTVIHLSSANPLAGSMFIAIKMIIDFPLILQTSKFFNAKKLMLLYPLLSILYPFYVTITLVSSILLPNTWKKRRIKHERKP